MKKKIVILLTICLTVLCCVIDITQRIMSENLCSAINGHDRNLSDIARLIDKTWNLNSLNGYAFMTNVDYYITTPMSAACDNSDYEIVELLIEKGASVNYIRGDVYSPLTCITGFYRTDGSDYALLELLLKNGANPDFAVRDRCPILDICGSTIIYKEPAEEDAKEQECLRAIKLLIEYGVMVDSDIYGETVLHKLSRNDNATCLDYILDNFDLNINAQDSQGHTPLIEAARLDYSSGVECLKLLLKNGADKGVKDDNGMTAYDYAVERGNPLMDMLIVE